MSYMIGHLYLKWRAALICLAIGALVGCVNGFGVSYFRIPAFIMTLGCMVMVRGFALMIADGGTVNPGKLAESFFLLGGGYMLGVPTPIYVFAIVCIIAAVVLSFTPFGRAIYAVGSNEEAGSPVSMCRSSSSASTSFVACWQHFPA